ncbi:GNAT family N-acetyltransferase [Rhizobium sp. SL86]|uniref:GNAT family N-acetyltransferase n=1 Tax=Rhizobium sp. SL86 TaxID=2995148 RepID=UPI0022753CCE|nr:GNAT family N-acetyltransferase [Rhizobium sp. SL86]MCY1666769.1 GNAT family N-acetyltransferase [Rhizobium sp. SL86]
MLSDDTLTIQPMVAEHLPGALRLSQAEKWPHRIEDWTLILNLSKGVVAIDNDEVVATAMTTPFGSVATLNMIIVAERMRGRGLGRKMMERVMRLIEPKEWRLVATQDGLPLYEKLGFRQTGKILQHQGVVQAPADAEQLARPGADGLGMATSEDLAILAALDERATGMDRTSLVCELLQVGAIFAIRAAGCIVAFAAVRPFGRGEVVGPVVAADAGQAHRLLGHILAERAGKFVRVDTEASTGLAPWLSEHGLAHAGGGIAMRLGPPVPDNGPPYTFALAAQALG